MKCLSCSAEMVNNLVQTRRNEVAYDICPACGSLWLDASELDKVAFQVEGSIEFCSRDEAEGSAEPGRECPRCTGLELEKVAFLGRKDVLLDHCSNCGGFWLDGGELDLINRELESIMPVEGRGFSDFVNNVHLPYWHKRVRRRSVETDFTVDVPPLKHAELRKETTAVCPACGACLNLYEAYGIDIEGCPACKGMWLEKEQLRALKDRSDRDSWRSLRWLDEEVEAIEKVSVMPSDRACPRCPDSKLVSTCFGASRVLIDWCPGCHGVWLDGGEFREILSYLRKKLDRMGSAEMKQKVYEEIRDIWNGPEDKIAEILDVKAAVSALVNITIFEHPALCDLLMRFSHAARAMGL